MMSHSVDKWERRDESQTCSRLQQYRAISRREPRSIQDTDTEVLEDEYDEDHDHEMDHVHDSSEGRAARQMQVKKNKSTLYCFLSVFRDLPLYFSALPSFSIDII